MVRAWIADISPLIDQECYEYYYRKLPDFRRKKADKQRMPLMRAQSVGVWILWQKVRQKYSLSQAVPFNLSHSGSYVMCAAMLGGGEGRVGCDLEKIGTFREAVARRFFCPEEYDTIMRACSETDRAELFYRYWVLKESFMKATERGMALAADAFSIRLDPFPVLVRKPKEFPEHYYYMEYKKADIPYRMAVCTTEREIDTTLCMEFEL